jgi:GSH-dependent disulfide-bond oxidoreductase
MIDLYTWITPNGLKLSILLEELGLPYAAHAVDITKGAQDEPAFRRVSPSGKIPAIRDGDLALMESGVIMPYLADKAGLLLPAGGAERLRVLEWLMWQVGNFGPTLAQAHHFVTYHPELAPAAATRFLDETRRLYAVLDRRLADAEHVAGAYSIADVAIWPWVSRFARHRVDLKDFSHVRRWYSTLAVRPAVQRGYRVPHDTGPVPLPGWGR